MSTARKLTAVPAPDPGTPEDEVHLSLWDHIKDLRKRLIYSVIAVSAGFVVCYYFSDSILHWLLEPLLASLPPDDCQAPLKCDTNVNAVLMFIDPVDPLFAYIRIAAYAGLFVACPVILYQVYAFVAPGLYRRERRVLVPFVVFGTVMFAAGGLFSRYVIMPFAFQVLIGQYTTAWLRPQMNLSHCVDLLLMMFIAFGVIFELPLVLTLLAKIGLVSSAFLSKYRRHAIVVNTIIAAIITPTGDPFNLALMAVPLCIFYELGIIGARLAERSRKETA